MKEQSLWMELAKGATRGARLKREAQVLRCLAGRVWVTLEGEPRDFVLRAGDSMVVQAAGRLVVLALDAAEVTLAPAQRVLLHAA